MRRIEKFNGKNIISRCNSINNLRLTFSDDSSKQWVDGVSIVVPVLIVVLVGSITDYQKEKNSMS